MLAFFGYHVREFTCLANNESVRTLFLKMILQRFLLNKLSTLCVGTGFEGVIAFHIFMIVCISRTQFDSAAL